MMRPIRLVALLVGLCLFIPYYTPPQAQAAIANPRNTPLGKIYAAAVSVDFATLPSSGSQICARAAGFRSGTVTAAVFTDNQGNTYSSAVFIANVRWVAIGCTTVAIGTPSGTFTVTVTPTGGTGGALEAVASEYTGLGSGNVLDKIASGSGSSTTLDTTATATTTQADELLLYVAAANSSSATTTYTENVTGSAPSSGWTEDFTDADDTNFLSVTFGSVIVSSTVAARHVITVSGAGPYSWAAAVATFTAAGGATPDVTKFRLRLNQ